MVKKEKILTEKVQLWDKFFPSDQAVMKIGGTSFTEEKWLGNVTEAKTKPNEKKKAEKFKGVLLGGSKKGKKTTES